MNVRFLQQVIHQMKDVMNRNIGVITDGGFVISSTDGCISAHDAERAQNYAEENTETFAYNGFTYKPVFVMGKIDSIIFVQGEDSLATNYADILQVNFSSIKTIYNDKHDKNNFIKNILMDNILPGDVVAKAVELHFPIDTKRVVFLVKTEKTSDYSAFEVIENMYPDKQKDFVVSLDDEDIAIVKELESDPSLEDLEKMAQTIVDTLNAEILIRATVGIGTTVSSVREISKSYKEARSALEIGKVFDNEKSIISYEDLGIGRLIYHLPTTLCELFLSEVFKKGSIEELDSEIIFTIQKFFENNLNVSETSRQLYVHRNTLVYRLDKIQKITGLDLRIFDQAIVFKVAMMVNKYLSTGNISI